MLCYHNSVNPIIASYWSKMVRLNGVRRASRCSICRMNEADVFKKEKSDRLLPVRFVTLGLVKVYIEQKCNLILYHAIYTIYWTLESDLFVCNGCFLRELFL
jgi:hypothetical protein